MLIRCDSARYYFHLGQQLVHETSARSAEMIRFRLFPSFCVVSMTTVIRASGSLTRASQNVGQTANCDPLFFPPLLILSSVLTGNCLRHEHSVPHSVRHTSGYHIGPRVSSLSPLSHTQVIRPDETSSQLSPRFIKPSKIAYMMERGTLHFRLKNNSNIHPLSRIEREMSGA